MSHEAREKKQLLTLESFAKSLKDEELRIKNLDKATANFAKQFTKKKGNRRPDLKTLKISLWA